MASTLVPIETFFYPPIYSKKSIIPLRNPQSLFKLQIALKYVWFLLDVIKLKIARKTKAEVKERENIKGLNDSAWQPMSTWFLHAYIFYILNCIYNEL